MNVLNKLLHAKIRSRKQDFPEPLKKQQDFIRTLFTRDSYDKRAFCKGEQ